MTTLPADPRTRRPRILFLHRSPGGQFGFFGSWLADNGWDVAAACSAELADDRHDDMQDAADPLEAEAGAAPRRVLWRFDYRPHSVIDDNDFRHAVDFAARNALAAAELFYRLRHVEDYIPDVVMAHVGWGVGLCVKSIWPETAYIAYHEWYYTDRGWDGAQRQERPSTLASLVGDRIRNLPISTEFDTADANWCPTRFQASRFPPVLRRMLTVVSDGVDCDFYRPDPDAVLDFSWLTLPAGTRVLTYATRGMEPTRGFPQFLRAVQELQRRRDDFHTVVLANETVAYGSPLPPGDSWRLRMLDTLDLDQRRLHVFGMRARPEYRRVLQVSAVHVYFSEPFVTSWSLSEALAAGCMVVGSDTAPVRELISDGRTGLLVDMDDPEEVADMIEWGFDNPARALALRTRARAQMLRRHDKAHVFPAKEARLRALIARRRGG